MRTHCEGCENCSCHENIDSGLGFNCHPLWKDFLVLVNKNGFKTILSFVDESFVVIWASGVKPNNLLTYLFKSPTFVEMWNTGVIRMSTFPFMGIDGENMKWPNAKVGQEATYGWCPNLQIQTDSRPSAEMILKLVVKELR
jgi:hypothetical protein